MQTFAVFVHVVQSTAFPSLRMQKAMYKQQFIRSTCDDKTVLAGAFYWVLDRNKRTILSHKAYNGAYLHTFLSPRSEDRRTDTYPQHCNRKTR